ncbi:MAG: response regulator transcription factor [Clostridia bacterium]|nr:response regulator transcription factor [Clostridia bacterium]
MLRIAVCDDDFLFRKQIAEIMNRWEQKPENAVFEIFDNGDELISAHKTSPFDIILLDILMPLINGIETAREIRQNDKNTKIVFLTSSPEFAVESYTVKADNYLLKPVSEKALFCCLDELAEEIGNKAKTIAIKGIYNVYKLVVDDIVYVEAQNKHIVFSMLDGSKIETTEPLHICEEKLIPNKEFFKCHRSYIVNINHIDKYTSKEIRMHNGSFIPISRSYQKDFEFAYYATLFGEAGAGS